jgi:Family of unknown function (DUF6272)
MSTIPLQISEKLRESNLVFAYRGRINGDAIGSLLQLAESRLKSMEPIQKRKKNVLNVLIEGMQNMYYHGKGTPNSPNPVLPIDYGMVGFGLEDNAVMVYTCNLATQEQKAKLETNISRLNALSKTELHQLYLETLDKGGLSPEGGAGLGLIRMRRESGNPLLVNFVPVSDNIFVFCLTVTVDQIYSQVPAAITPQS